MKLALKIVAGLVVLLVVVLIASFFYVDSIARKGVEFAATSALGTDTTLDSINVGIFGGTVKLDHLNVANPSAVKFDSPHFLHLDQGSVAVSLGSLMKDQVVVPSLKLDGLDMYLEKKGSDSNYQLILDNLSKGEKKTEDPSTSTEPGKKFIINELVLTNISVEANLLPLGGNLTKTKLVIPEIRLTDVGSESEGGVVLSELSGIIVKAIMQAVITKGGDLPMSLISDLGSGLGDLKEIQGKIQNISEDLNKSIDDVTKGLGDATKGLDDATKGIGDATKGIDDVTKGLGDLFGKKKDDAKKVEEKK